MSESGDVHRSKQPRGFSGLEASLSTVDVDAQSEASRDHMAPAANASVTAPKEEESLAPQDLSTLHSIEKVPGGSAVSPTAWLVLGTCVVVGALILFFSSNRSSVGPTPAAVQLAPAIAQPPPQFVPTLAVAPISANLRSESSARSKVLGQAPRGTGLERLGEATGFVNVKLQDGRQGWIARELTIDSADASRLDAMTARQYVETRKPLRGLESLREQLSPYRTMLELALVETGEESPRLDQTLTEISEAVHVSVPADSAGAIWFGLEAKSYSDKGMLTEALESATAAIFADPANVDAQVAFAFAAIRLGDYANVKAIASILPLLAPTATNTWVIVGVSAASENASDLARNAFVSALRKSRNPKVTEKFLNELAIRSTDVRVSAAIGAALERLNTSREHKR